LDEALGIDFGEERDHIPRNHNNPDGYFENAEFLTFNDRVLQAAGGWVLAPPPLHYPTSMDSGLRESLVDEARRLLGKYADSGAAFGWKDPRLSFTLPIWRAACPGIVPIIAFRRPGSVLASIGAQLDRPVDSLRGLWFEYYRHVVSHTEGLPRYFVSFDQVLTAPNLVVSGIASHLGLQIDEAHLAARLAEIVKPQQSRHTVPAASSTPAATLDEDTESLYAYLNTTIVERGEQPDDASLRHLLRLN
jgi:hypothetical protein